MKGMCLLRKVIQIVVYDKRLVALCDDGTMWEYYCTGWEKIDDIPRG